MVFEVSVLDNFCASHYLTGIGGPEAAMHGHDFRIVVTFSTTTTNDVGFVAHSRDLKRFVRKVLAPMDFSCLNDLAQFATESPTLEYIAALILASLQEVRPPHIHVASVSVQTEDGYIVKCVDNFKYAT